jgi:S1-C subfamily serine protease
MKQFRIVVWAMCLASTAAADIDYAVARSVVQIQAKPPEGGRVFMGSGVVVADGRVATNCHVTLNASSIFVRKGGLRFPAVRERADVKRDLCLLDVAGLGSEPAKLGRANRLVAGDTLYLLGFPRALGLSWSKGTVRSLHPYRGGRIIETSADFAEGASGGGLFNGRSELVGIATFFSAGRERHYFAIPVEWIPLVQKSAAAREIGPFSGLPFWQDSHHLPSFLRVPRPR